MKLLLGTIAACALIALPAMAGLPDGAGQLTVPSAQNSGVGIPGLPGTESGPAIRPHGAFAKGNQNDLALREQDSAGIVGEPDSESGLQ